MFLIPLQSAAEDSMAAGIPSFTDRINFTLPLIVILFIITFFLLLKSYTSENEDSYRTKGKFGGATGSDRNKNG